jgi:hypothetical protein
LSARIQSLGETSAGPAINRDAGDVQVVGIHVVIIAGVGDGATHQFADRFGSVDIGELEQRQGFADALAANRIGDAAKFARPHAHEA